MYIIYIIYICVYIYIYIYIYIICNYYSHLQESTRDGNLQ